MKARAGLALMTSSLAAVGTLALATPAHASLTTHCVGTAGAVTVPGDLYVPAGEACALEGTTVTGNVVVAEGADLLIEDGTFDGSVTVEGNGFFEAVGTSISGDVSTTDAYGVDLTSSQLGGSVVLTGEANAKYPTYGFVFDSTVAGIDSTAAELLVESSSIEGSVTSEASLYADLVDSVVNGDLSVTGAELGSVFCAGEVYGDAVFDGNADVVQLGGTGPVLNCEGTSFWGGNVTVSGTTGDVVVAENIIRGDLAGEGNDTTPVVSNNRVRGTVSGQFAAQDPAVERKVMPLRVSLDRTAELENRSEERRTEAEEAAIAAGPANL
ncbi:hypothetical protein [Actinoalloteichus hymeniacidonis]|uniref:Polymer-forming cytoskeletal n=1 Tax=Actinoalloteichus hymeniacidonis TaxID=340345 RepID=A0AAC9HQ02_9PSEU|nr:hypothetical protein [Actinoalloteichus hymeniacidonis]AOS63427.1 hypothetical protein TL08_13065 [Actinoalloteichus hymeniacidonis]MBB5908531.1 phage-related protein [Actinoalloteichus hymeniacidonis]